MLRARVLASLLGTPQSLLQADILSITLFRIWLLCALFWCWASHKAGAGALLSRARVFSSLGRLGVCCFAGGLHSALLGPASI